MTPQLRHELESVGQAIDQEIKNMRGGNNNGGSQPSWMKRRAAPAELPEATGWSVPVELDTRDGKVTVYLSFGPETFPEAEAIIDALVQEGYPVKAWKPKPPPTYEERGGGRGFNRDRDDRGGYNGGGRRSWRD